MANRSYSSRTIKILFGSSGNQCAHPDCVNPIIAPGSDHSDDAVQGQICHIYAASDNGPRGNAALTDAERNRVDNLILLCGFHHPMVDSQHQDYPPELLKQWKKSHEAKFQQDTGESIRRQNQVQQSAFTVQLTDQQIEAELHRLVQARHLVGYAGTDHARALAARVENTEFAGGSSSVRAQALAWCARLLAKVDVPRAKALMEKSRDLGESDENRIARAVVLAAETGDTAAALLLLAQMETPESRSAMLRLVTNEQGTAAALGWLQSAGLRFNSFDSDGKLSLIMNEEVEGSWAEAYAHVQQLTPQDFEDSPALNYAAAQAHLANVVPEELRAQTMFQLPFNAPRVPLADDRQSQSDRKRAIDLFQKQADIAEKFGAGEAAQLSLDLALWLRLRDPELHDKALDDLRRTMLRRFPMAVSFGLEVDRDAVERRINERVALTGKGTLDAAVARLALAMEKEAPAALAYIDAHRNQLDEFLDDRALLTIEIELLCRSGQVNTAKVTLGRSSLLNLGEREKDRLQRMIAEAEGADPATERRKQYEATGDLRDLVVLVGFLEQKQAWRDLRPLAEELFSRTCTVEDAFRVAQALAGANEHRRLLDFLGEVQDIVTGEDELQSLLAWTLYRDGQFIPAFSILKSLREKRDNSQDRALFVNLAIASGQWDMLVGYIAQEWQDRKQRTAEELLRAGQLAQAVNAPQGKALVVAATQAAPSDPGILAPAYFYAASAGWETDAEVAGWLPRAASLSDDQGPLKSMTMKELSELKPDWDRRRDETYKALLAGQMPISIAASWLNQSMTQNCLLRPASNRSEPDARRRSLVFAFSGARTSMGRLELKRVALDLTAVFTFAQLGLLTKLIEHFERVLVPDQLLVWLFQERQRVVFHQPSRIKDARHLKRLIADGSLKIFASAKAANLRIAQEVGFDLAAMLETAIDSSDAYVIRSAPILRLGSVMGEMADVSKFASRLCSCQAVVDALRLKGRLTTTEEQRALSYLKLNERRWPDEPRIPDGATLYLDDLSTTYLRTAGVLGKLKGAGFTVYLTKSLDDQDNQLLAYESVADEQLATIESIRAVLASGLSEGRVETIASPEADSDDAQPRTQLNFLVTDKPLDAFVVDDRFVNRYLHMTRGEIQTPICTSLDVIEHLVCAGSMNVEEAREHRTTLRRSGYTFVPVLEDELTHYLLQAPVEGGSLVETAELRAIREAAQRLRLERVLQGPHELVWLNRFTLALVRAVRKVWEAKGSTEAPIRCEWLLRQLDVRAWAPDAAPGAATRFSVMAYAGLLHVLCYAPKAGLEGGNESYHRWVDSRVLSEIEETEPEIFDQIVAQAVQLFRAEDSQSQKVDQ
jgi:hypothetical protein